MVTDGWQEVQSWVAGLLGRGDPQEETRQQARLERAHEEVVGCSGEQAARMREMQAGAWRTRFEDLLEDVPEAEGRVRELVEFLGQVASAAAAGAVQGQGVQNNTFTTAIAPSTAPAPPQ